MPKSCEFNRIERNEGAIGVICCGATYQHVREALPQADILKLGMSWPLPPKKTREFAASVENVYVIEEGSDYLSEGVRALGVQLSEPGRYAAPDGELTPAPIAAAFGAQARACRDARRFARPSAGAVPWLPASPRVPRAFPYARPSCTGDIGCYTLGALAPLSAMDTCVDMGASISMSHGFELGLQGREHQPVVAVIGDSTFGAFGHHVASRTRCTTAARVSVCILDNRTTAMTGHQGNPVNGITLQHREVANLICLVWCARSAWKTLPW